ALLTFWAGVAGAFVATVVLYGNTPQAFFDQLLVLTHYLHLWGSILRLTLFGVLIGLVAAYKGMQVSGGAEGVGRAVNESVVTSLVVVGVVTLVYTTLFEAFFPEVNFVL